MPEGPADDDSFKHLGRDGEAPRVLVVDDHESMCRLVKHQLEREGHEVKVAHSVRQGMSALGEHFDVAVLDVDLPDGQGFELVDALRKSTTAPTSVVMMTGSPSRDTLQHSLNQGILEFLFKPFRSAEIREAVARALQANRRWHERLAILEGRFLREGPDTRATSSPTELSEADISRLVDVLGQRHALTERERETLDLVLRGLQNSEIALRLDISANTVKYHVRNLLTKLGVESRMELFRSLLNQ